MSLAADLRRIASRRTGDLQRIAEESLLITGQRIISATPVRDGAARGNWLSSVGSIDTSFSLSVKDPSGTASNGRLQAAVQGLEPGTEFYFTNSLPYAERLENGWSQQAPQGMVKINMASWSSVVSRAVARYR